MNFAAIRAKIDDYIWSYNPCDPDRQHSSWHHFLQIMMLVARELKGGMLNLRSMGLVYTTLLAFIPMLAGSMWVLKRLGVHEQLEPGLASLLAPLGEQSAEFSSRVVEFVENMEIGLLGLMGLGMLLYTAVSLMRKIESAFNHTWRLQNKRRWLNRVIIYLGLLAIGPALVFSALAVTASLANHSILTKIIELPILGNLVEIFGKFLPYMLVIVAFTLIYLTVPYTRVKIGSAFYGGLLAGAVWQGTGTMFAIFVGGSTSYTIIYSGFAIVLLLMIWVYISWLILLVGASIAYYHQHPEQIRWRNLNAHLDARLRDRLALQLMLNIGRSQDPRAKIVSSIEGLASCQQIPVDIVRRLLDALEAQNLVRRSDDDAQLYLPARPLNRILLIDILQGSYDTEDAKPGTRVYCDAVISKLVDDIQASYSSILGESTLTELLAQYAEDYSDENSVV